MPYGPLVFTATDENEVDARTEITSYKLAMLGLLASIVGCLCWSFYNAAAWLGFAFIVVVGVGVWYIRQQRLKHISRVQAIVYGVFHAVCFVPILVQFAMMASQGSWYGSRFYPWLLFVGLGGLLAFDVLYLYLRTDNRGVHNRVARAVTFSTSFVLYVTSIISVFYLGKINRSIEYYNNNASATVRVPQNATDLCTAKGASLNGTVTLIWPTTSSDPRCAYIFWEHLRGNTLFSISFILLVLLIRDACSDFSVFIQTSSLCVYLGYFVAVTSIVDDLDSAWQITIFEFVLLEVAFAIHAVVVCKRVGQVAAARVAGARLGARLNTI